MIPKFTTPQAKMIRTLEGLVVVAFNLAMVVIPIVTNALPAPTAVKYAAIVNTAAVTARSLAKGIMAWQSPMMPDVAPPLDLSSNEPTAPDSLPDPFPVARSVGGTVTTASEADILRQQVKDLGGNPNA